MNTIALLHEHNFAQQMDDIVIPFLDSHKTIKNVDSCKGGEIHCKSFIPDGDYHSTLVIFHGFCEFSSKYDEFIYHALKQGFSVCIFEHRGHGFSSRNDIINENYSIVDIDSYDTYVTDAKTVVETIAKPLANGKPLFLFSHSMGGAIATLYLSKYANDFTSAILDAPMLQISITKLPFWMGRLAASFLQLFYGKGKLIVSHREFPFDHVLNEEKEAATSVARYNYFYNKRKTNKLWQTWGASNRWVCQTIDALRLCNKKSLLKKITAPILLFQAEKDIVVCPAGQDNFVKHVKSAEKVIVKDSDHEMFIGKTELAISWYEKIYSFYEKFLNNKGR